MKKSLYVLAVSLLVGGLVSCGANDSSSSAIGSSSDAVPSSSVSSSSSVSLPTTASEVAAYIASSRISGYTFTESGEKKANGTVSFNDDELLVSGKATFEEEGEANLLIYKSLKNKSYIDIDTYSGNHARKKSVVDNVSDSNVEITEKDAKSDIASVRYGSSFFTGEARDILAKNPSIASKENSTGYNVSFSCYVSGTTTVAISLNFDSSNELLGGELTSNTWGTSNFDKDKKAPIDSDQKPESKSVKKIETTLGDKPFSLNFDYSPYFVSSIDEFTVTGFDNDKKANNGKAEIGQYIYFSLDKFSPSTAINDGDIKITATSNPNVISLSELTGSAKAESAGTSVLTISDPTGTIKKEVTVTVSVPTMKYIYTKAAKSTIEPGEKTTISVEFYPTAALEDIEAVSSNSSIVKVNSVFDNRTSVEIEGVAEGSATISVYKKGDTSVKGKDITITVKKKEVVVDVSFIIGEWECASSTYEGKFTFNEDKTGKVEMTVDDLSDSATFKWSYDGTAINFSSWSSAGDEINEPTEGATISEDKKSLSVKLELLDGDGEGYYKPTLTFNKKAEDVSWLIGTWKDSEDAIATLVFNADYTGTFKSSIYGGEKGFSWKYENKTLTFSDWKDSYTTVKEVLTAKEGTLKIKFEDDEGYFTYTFEKI